MQRENDMKINWMPSEDRKKIAVLLNKILSDEFILYIKTLKFHWNLTGPHFNHMHKFFEAQYEELLENSDRVAERIRALDHEAFGTMTEFLKHSTLTEKPGQSPNIKEMVTLLLADHDALIKTLRKNIHECEQNYKDAVTSNFLQDLSFKHEKMAWMLRASLE